MIRVEEPVSEGIVINHTSAFKIVDDKARDAMPTTFSFTIFSYEGKDFT